MKSLDSVIENKAFMGLDTTELVNNGLGFGAEKDHPFIRENMEAYEAVSDFQNPELNSWITTRLLEPYGIEKNSTRIQYLSGITIYPTEYFCSKHTHTGIITRTAKTISIHHFNCSWDTEEGRAKQNERWKKYRKIHLRQAPKRTLRKILGDNTVDAIKRRLGL